jgi:hypothetical protein
VPPNALGVRRCCGQCPLPSSLSSTSTVISRVPQAVGCAADDPPAGTGAIALISVIGERVVVECRRRRWPRGEHRKAYVFPCMSTKLGAGGMKTEDNSQRQQLKLVLPGGGLPRFCMLPLSAAPVPTIRNRRGPLGSFLTRGGPDFGASAACLCQRHREARALTVGRRG